MFRKLAISANVILLLYVFSMSMKYGLPKSEAMPFVLLVCLASGAWLIYLTRNKTAAR